MLCSRFLQPCSLARRQWCGLTLMARTASTASSEPLKHDDVIVVPEFFCKEDDLDIYYTLVEEMREAQASGKSQSDWISWHEG
jgi:hypothetical protein